MGQRQFDLGKEFDTRLNFVAFSVGCGWRLLLQISFNTFAQSNLVGMAIAGTVVPVVSMLVLGLFCNKLLHAVLVTLVYILGYGIGSSAGTFLRTFNALSAFITFFMSMVGFTFWFWIVLLGFGLRRWVTSFQKDRPVEITNDQQSG